jgi:hypothetical protein
MAPLRAQCERARHRGGLLRRLAHLERWAMTAVCLSLGGCGATLPNVTLPAASELVDNSHATVISGRPDEIYQRIAGPAARCWFGPFGRLHSRFMTHADLPPPSSSAPVTLTVHRRLASQKKPWGPAMLRLELTGKTTTTLSFANLGLAPAEHREMTRGLTRWANGRTDCGEAFTPASADRTVAQDIATGATGAAKKR